MAQFLKFFSQLVIQFQSKMKTITQKLNPISVYHDIERDHYYRVDKQTGQVLRSYKNGAIVKSFKTDVTGTDYKKRREIENEAKRNGQIRKSTIPKLRHSQRASEKFFNMEQDHSHNHKESAHMSGSRIRSQENDANFVTNFDTIDESMIAKQHSHMGNLLKHFSKINEQKIYQNHCSSNKNTGTVLTTKLLLNSKGFRETKNVLFKPFDVKKRREQQVVRTQSQNSEQREHWGRQVSKEKKLFLQFHPVYEQRQNSRIVKEQVQRKKNIKKLEQLFLEQTSKVTNHIYS